MSVSIKQFAPVPSPSLPERIATIGAWLARAWQAYTTRRALAELDDHALADLGLSRAQARFEAGRSFLDLHGMDYR